MINNWKKKTKSYEEYDKILRESTKGAPRTDKEDLFYRLNEICIRIPLLRDRREDIPILLPCLLMRLCFPTFYSMLRKHKMAGRQKRIKDFHVKH